MSATSPLPLLQVKNVCVRFGGVMALDSVGFSMQAGTVCGVIGPNGAGKTTLFNCLSRLYTPSSGQIAFNGMSLLDMPVHAMAAVGLGRTFQNVVLFPSMSVLDNVMVGAHSKGQAGFVASALRLPSTRREEVRLRALARSLLSQFNLDGVANRTVSALPFGTRKRVELARAMATGPQLLMLDEPAAGLNHEEVDLLRETILKIRDNGTAVLLVEHHMNLVMRCSDQVVVLNFGRKIADGVPQDVQADPEVIRAYLGGQQHDTLP